MKITFQRAETLNKLKELIKTNSNDYFNSVTRNNKSIYVAYTPINGFNSVRIETNNKIYGFIKESLTDQEKEQELQILFNDKEELYHFNKDEIIKMDRLIEQQEIKKLSFKNVNYDDVKIIMENTTLNEYKDIVGFALKLKDSLNNKNDDGIWNYTSSLLYMFKLGVMQGKREERKKNKRKVNILN